MPLSVPYSIHWVAPGLEPPVVIRTESIQGEFQTKCADAPARISSAAPPIRRRIVAVC